MKGCVFIEHVYAACREMLLLFWNNSPIGVDLTINIYFFTLHLIKQGKITYRIRKFWPRYVYTLVSSFCDKNDGTQECENALLLSFLTKI